MELARFTSLVDGKISRGCEYCGPWILQVGVDDLGARSPVFAAGGGVSDRHLPANTSQEGSKTIVDGAVRGSEVHGSIKKERHRPVFFYISDPYWLS